MDKAVLGILTEQEKCGYNHSDKSDDQLMIQHCMNSFRHVAL